MLSLAGAGESIYGVFTSDWEVGAGSCWGPPFSPVWASSLAALQQLAVEGIL